MGLNKITLLDNGDWQGVYSGDQIVHQGHDIPDHVWLQLIHESDHDEVERVLVYDMRECDRFPNFLSDWRPCDGEAAP